MPIAERFQFLEERWRLKSLKNVACSDKIFRAVSEEPFYMESRSKTRIDKLYSSKCF